MMGCHSGILDDNQEVHVNWRIYRNMFECTLNLPELFMVVRGPGDIKCILENIGNLSVFLALGI